MRARGPRWFLRRLLQTGFLKKVVATELKGCPFGRRSPVATASTGTLIFDLGRSPHSVHVYSIPSPASVSSSRSGPPWSPGRSPLLRVIMDSSPSTPHFSPLLFPSPPPPLFSHREQNRNTGEKERTKRRLA